jgi:hypothetical protein
LLRAKRHAGVPALRLHRKASRILREGRPEGAVETAGGRRLVSGSAAATVVYGIFMGRRPLFTVLLCAPRYLRSRAPTAVEHRGPVARRGGDRMDLVYVALILGLFGLSWAFVVLCERL